MGGEFVWLGTALRLVFEYGGKWAGLGLVAYVALNKLLDRRDKERQEMMTQLTQQHAGLMVEIAAYRDLLASSIRTSEARTATAFDRLNDTIEKSTAALRTMGDHTGAMLERQRNHHEESEEHLSSIEATVDDMHQKLSEIKGGLH
jgi:hypothetical protein